MQGQTHGAMLVFAEHRYYGESVPAGLSVDMPLNATALQYLTMEQALADYASLIDHLKADRNTEGSAVIGFGGSYGGMLAAWLRMKYVHRPPTTTTPPPHHHITMNHHTHCYFLPSL